MTSAISTYSVCILDPITGHPDQCVARNRTLNDANAIAAEIEEHFGPNTLKCYISKDP